MRYLTAHLPSVYCRTIFQAAVDLRTRSGVDVEAYLVRCTFAYLHCVVVDEPVAVFCDGAWGLDFIDSAEVSSCDSGVPFLFTQQTDAQLSQIAVYSLKSGLARVWGAFARYARSEPLHKVSSYRELLREKFVVFCRPKVKLSCCSHRCEQQLLRCPLAMYQELVHSTN